MIEANYANKKASVMAVATIDGRRVLDARGDVPVDLSFRGVTERLPDLPIALTLRADTVPLGDFEGLSPRLTGLGGQLRGSVDVIGTLRRPRGRGTLDVTNGTFEVPRYGFVARGVSVSSGAHHALRRDDVVRQRPLSRPHTARGRGWGGAVRGACRGHRQPAG